MHLEEQKCNLRQTKSLWCVAMSWCTQNIVGALYCRHKYKHSKWKNELLSVTNTGQSASEPENSSQPVTGEVLEVAQSVHERENPSHQQLSGVNVGQLATELETGTSVVHVEVCEHEPGMSSRIQMCQSRSESWRTVWYWQSSSAM